MPFACAQTAQAIVAEVDEILADLRVTHRELVQEFQDIKQHLHLLDLATAADPTRFSAIFLMSQRVKASEETRRILDESYELTREYGAITAWLRCNWKAIHGIGA